MAPLCRFSSVLLDLGILRFKNRIEFGLCFRILLTTSMRSIKNFSYFVLIVVTFILSCQTSEDKVGKELEDEISNLLNSIVSETRELKKITLTPRTFVELNAILTVSNYFWTKELMSSGTNVSSEVLENYRTTKKVELLSKYGLNLEEFENYSVKNYQQLQKFSQDNPDLMEKYNRLSSAIPTLFEDY